MTTQEDHQFNWDEMIASIGQDFGGDDEHVADEAIEYTTVVRYCEPWEMGNQIYWNEEVAKQAGYRGVVAPWSGLRQTWAYRGRWRPDDPTRFPGGLGKDLNASQGGFLPTGKPLPMPLTKEGARAREGGLVTDLEMEFFEPACVGDRLSVKGKKLVNVRPRQTKIGDGAFYNTISELYNQLGQLVARYNFGMFSRPGQ